MNALIGEDPALEPLEQVLIARTGGNPFFLEESVRTLLETNRLVGEPGAYRLAQPIDALQIPASVQAVLAARIDRLPPADKRVLQAAAVVGQDVPLALLEAIADLPADALRASLARLRAFEFLRETIQFPSVEYTFTHALTHDVAYSSLLYGAAPGPPSEDPRRAGGAVRGRGHRRTSSVWRATRSGERRGARPRRTSGRPAAERRRSPRIRPRPHGSGRRCARARARSREP